MDRATGGYVIMKTPLIRTGLDQHTSALERPVSQIDLDALNAVQRTPWVINGWLLDVAGAAWDAGTPAGDLPTGEAPRAPERLPDEVWEGMSDEERRAVKVRAARAHSARASLEGRRHATLDKLVVATELRHRPAIWFPHTRDFRGRIYPITSAGPHPQSDDLGKALIQFSNGAALGRRGLYWLQVRAATMYGEDKVSFDERAAWTVANGDMVFRAASDPFDPDVMAWWSAADSPWQFLATCAELAGAISADNPEQFISHLPVPMDGSCNGLQHLSAMGLDPVGARATNLLPGPRQDIYEEVAEAVRQKIAIDAATGAPHALGWVGGVTRNVCKRAVMTTPYGVTARGIRTQLLQDGMVPESEERAKSAMYLTECLVEALGRTVRSARDIMGWLQDTAKVMAKAGLPFDWTTPTGSRCRQAYYQHSLYRVRTLMGSVSLADTSGSGMLIARKQAAGSAPNYVHSFDAAAMAMTVNACQRDGIRSLALIHDSYGAHAAWTDDLHRVLREQFVSIYRDDWLRRTYEQDILPVAGHLNIPPPPLRGSLDIEQVTGSEFFFS